jgi:hypothetical protein
MMKPPIRWALQWRSENKIDGKQSWIIWRNCLPLLFLDRKKARAYAEKEYGYIKERKDLRCEPHGWRMPRPVRVRVKLEIV